MVTWLKSPDMMMRALGCLVCNLETVVCKVPQAAVGFAVGGMYTMTMMTCGISLGRWYGRRPTANTSASGLHSCSLMLM